jgi:hypothetical protein
MEIYGAFGRSSINVKPPIDSDACAFLISPKMRVALDVGLMLGADYV